MTRASRITLLAIVVLSSFAGGAQNRKVRLSLAILLFLAAPDIIKETAGEKRNPERAAQFYANNAARVMAVRPGSKGEVSQANIAWSERKGVPGVPSPLYYNGLLYTFQNGGIVYCRVAKTGELVYSGRLGAPGYYYSSRWLPITRFILHPKRAWWSCWMLVNS